MTKTSLIVILASLLLSWNSRPVVAQFYNGEMQGASATGNLDGISVTGKGYVSEKPNRMEIDLEVTASSELSADAIVKYRDAKKRIEDAFVALKLDNVTVEERGLLVDQKGAEFNPYYFDSQPSRKTKVEVQLTRKLVIKCSEIRKLEEEALLQLVAKLLDVAQDAGGKIGSSPDMAAYYYGRYNPSQSGLVRFILDDYEKLEEQAYTKAVADANTRAQRLAKLNQVNLGPVKAIRETTFPGQSSARDGDDPAKHWIESARFQPIPVRVELLIQFNTAVPQEKRPKGGNP